MQFNRLRTSSEMGTFDVLRHEAQEVPRCDKTAATRQDKAIHIVTAARCAYAARSRQFQQEHVGGDMDPDVRCARDCEAGIARQQHFSLAALARDAINGKRSETEPRSK